MSDKQQSAVDFLAENLEKLIPAGNQILIDIFLTQAKELFKQQIIDAYNKNPQGFNHSGNRYFNETFKTESNGK